MLPGFRILSGQQSHALRHTESLDHIGEKPLGKRRLSTEPDTAEKGKNGYEKNRKEFIHNADPHAVLR